MKTGIPTKGSMVKNHISLKTEFGLFVTQRTSFQLWFLACQRVRLVDLTHQLRGHFQDRRVIVQHLLQAQDDSGSYAVFTEQGSSASQMTAAKIMDIISRLSGCDGQAADAVSAYTQVKMEDAHKLLKIPKSECPDNWIRLPRHKWPKSWSSMEDPVVPLERSGAGPCRSLDGVRDKQFALFCGAHHPPRDDMDCRPGANVELGVPLVMVRHGSRRQSQLDSASEPLERKCVVDVHRVLSVVSRAQQQFPELHGAGRTDTPRSVGVQRRGRFVHPQPDGCGDRRVWKEVCRAVRCLREGVLLLHVPCRWQGQLLKHYCRVRRHGLHASPAYTTPGTIPPFFSAAPAAVVATPSAVVVPAPALSYSLCFPTVSAAPAPV